VVEPKAAGSYAAIGVWRPRSFTTLECRPLLEFARIPFNGREHIFARMLGCPAPGGKTFQSFQPLFDPHGSGFLSVGWRFRSSTLSSAAS
jgi:hypothetical protein